MIKPGNTETHYGGDTEGAGVELHFFSETKEPYKAQGPGGSSPVVLKDDF